MSLPDKLPQTDGLNSRNYFFFIVLGLEVQDQGVSRSVSFQACLLVLQMAVFPPRLHVVFPMRV